MVPVSALALALVDLQLVNMLLGLSQDANPSLCGTIRAAPLVPLSLYMRVLVLCWAHCAVFRGKVGYHTPHTLKNLNNTLQSAQQTWWRKLYLGTSFYWDN